MRLAFLIAAVASLVGGAAAACPEYDGCPRGDHHEHGHHHRWSDEAGLYEYDYWEERGDHERHERGWEDRRGGCREACGEVSLPASFFYDAGGVGPIPDTGFVGGGGFVFADSFASSRASAFAAARASASAHVSVRIRGGFKGHKGHHGGKRR